MPLRPPAPLIAPGVAAAIVVVALAAPAHAAPPRGWWPDVRAARAFARSRAGEVAFSVRTERRDAGLHVAEPFAAASVVKAMLLVAYLRAPAVRARALTPDDRHLLTPMIRWSSNRDATKVFERLGIGALPALARRARMRHFTGGTYWSASKITAADQSRFFLRIDRLLPRRHRAYAMGLLRRIVLAQRWGVATVAPPRWTLYFKGGWTTQVQHQVALLVHGDQRVAIAVLTRGSPSPAYGRATETGIFERLLRGL
jgi:hypothetical protein